MRPVAGRIFPKTSSSGIFSTKRRSAVSVRRLTRMFVPKPKKAFQSPGTHSLGFEVVFMDLLLLVGFLVGCDFHVKAARILSECDTHPKMPPWALIMRNPIS